MFVTVGQSEMLKHIPDATTIAEKFLRKLVRNGVASGRSWSMYV